ncbi:MAG TPA: hypothetical protein PLI68_03590 [Bacteroidia bacterium]|nr:hypothetical protein [Bacteroidia bacterium]HRH08634.1 hypothetical protein [Bacteroidia bacterium]HRH62387.1 hypothetical protein [Bacteroidia bacterium]
MLTYQSHSLSKPDNPIGNAKVHIIEAASKPVKLFYGILTLCMTSFQP